MGLDLVFNQVDEAIILEYDCLPDRTFFRFCQKLLEYYRDDERIMVISGDNFQLEASAQMIAIIFLDTIIAGVGLLGKEHGKIMIFL